MGTGNIGNSPQPGYCEKRNTGLDFDAMTGRPTIRTDEIVESILDQLGDGTPLAKICRQEGMPKLRTFYDWAEADADLSARVARARVAGHDNIAQDAIDIADDSQHDFKMGKEGLVFDSEHVQRSKLRIDTRFKLLRCWDPKRFGEKLEIDNKGELTINVGVKRFTPDPEPTT